MKLEVKATGARRISDFDQLATVDYTCEPTGEFKEFTLDANEEYILSITAYTRFWANKAQYNDAVKLAVKSTKYFMYQELVSHLMLARQAIFDGDAKKALRAIENAISETGVRD